ncbi:O-antigen ligase family protein [Synechococcus sp. HK01-R]|uniref:O-antigen ligase family protein n=1 Tax=Synechococcus sp. HK01-R TaxID=2751171 RepID=UPI00210338A2|nr:O-antigen ligase family protein [Synechococcus sp. HK01-R]
MRTRERPPIERILNHAGSVRLEGLLRLPGVLSQIRTFVGSPWLDALLPLSLLGLALERSEDPAGMVWLLALWCGLKFASRLPAQPAYGVLIGVLMVSLSAVLHPLSLSSPADLILVLLAFAAGLQQSGSQWRIALWMLLCGVLVSLPFIAWDRSNGNLALIPLEALREGLPEQAVRIQKITINRSGYLFGLFSLIGYGLARKESCPRLAWLAAAGGALAYLLAFATGSRAAAAFPLVAVLLCELCWRHRLWVARRSGWLASMVLVLALAFNLLLYVPLSPLANRNPSDAGRASVAQCFVRESLRSGADLFSGSGFDRRSDRCLAITAAIPGRDRGIPHAHNAFLQVLADQGALTLTLLIVVLWCSLQRLLAGLVGADGAIAFVGLACLSFMVSSSLVESTLIKTSLQQVVSGYLLAIAWRRSPGSPQGGSQAPELAASTDSHTIDP